MGQMFGCHTMSVRPQRSLCSQQTLQRRRPRLPNKCQKDCGEARGVVPELPYTITALTASKIAHEGPWTLHKVVLDRAVEWGRPSVKCPAMTARARCPMGSLHRPSVNG